MSHANKAVQRIESPIIKSVNVRSFRARNNQKKTTKAKAFAHTHTHTHIKECGCWFWFEGAGKWPTPPFCF